MPYEKTETSEKDYASAVCLYAHNIGAGGVDQFGGAELPSWSLINQYNQANRNKRYKQMLARSDRAAGKIPQKMIEEQKTINQQVKEGGEAGIAICCTQNNDDGVVGFLMREKTSSIEVKIKDQVVHLKVSSKELLSLSKIITNTLE